MAAIEETRVGSWMELQEALFSDSHIPEWGRWRSSFAFRGLSNAAYRLTNSLTRMGKQYPQLEPSLLRSFRKYAPKAVFEQDSEWSWLTVGQHHGLPTRLLDWTWSPMVAAHFATEDLREFDKDGAIWMVNVVAVRDELPDELKKILLGHAYVFDVKMLSQEVATIQNLNRMSKKDFLLFFEPPSIDERVVNQYACFSVMDDPNRAVDDWLITRPSVYRKIVIPAGLKWEVRDKLDQVNLTERVLYPGLDGLSSWLRRNYYAR